MGFLAERREPRRRFRAWARRAGRLTVLALAALLALWIGIHRTTWLGPALAEGARALLGPGPVAWVEDVAYGIDDWYNRWRYGDRPPESFWKVPSSRPPAGPRPAAARAQPEAGPAAPVPDAAPGAAPFAPRPFVPPFSEVATGADGIWVAVPDADDPAVPVAICKTVVHPDRRRSFAGLAVVAVDLRALDLHLVAGFEEPDSPRVPRVERQGLVSPEHRGDLVAAFNGGFRATHGHYGMMLGGKTFLPPRQWGCTLAKYGDGALELASWPALQAGEPRMAFYRQMPPCLVEAGEIHKGLRYDEYAKGWGATVSGDTIIRRSALGLDEARQILFYGLGEAMSAPAIALGMKAAGAHAVAELDVNHAYPRFLFYGRREDGGGPRAVAALIPAIEFHPAQYVGQASPRDFFYLTRRRQQAARRPGQGPPQRIATRAGSPG
ncbi:MAG: hypothetical protein HY744_10875 [Deltaproteobacteria bacterium]|nr:hypothetical protein [Deltaproteobacteria bacterium]